MRPLAATAGRSGGVDGVEAAALPAQSRLGDAAAEMLGGALIGRRRAVLGPLVGIRLRHRAEERAEPVEILGAALARIVARHQAEPDPDHGVLGGEDGELLQRAELVAALARRVGEAGGGLVLPGLGRPRLRAGIHEGFEGGRGAADIRRGAEDDWMGGAARAGPMPPVT